jgi:hypothetical protein
MTPPTWFLLTFFLCPPGATHEAYCGPSTGNYVHASEAACVSAGQAWRDAQETAGLAVPGTIRFKCWKPGMGLK